MDVKAHLITIGIILLVVACIWLLIVNPHLFALLIGGIIVGGYACFLYSWLYDVVKRLLK